MGRELSYRFLDNTPNNSSDSSDSFDSFKYFNDEQFLVYKGNDYFVEGVYSVGQLFLKIQEIVSDTEKMFNKRDEIKKKEITESDILEYMREYHYDPNDEFIYNGCKKELIDNLQYKLKSKEEKIENFTECLMAYTTLLNKCIQYGNKYIEISY